MLTIGVYDLKRRCAEWSVYDIKVPRERFESIRIHLRSYRSRGTLMSYLSIMPQRRFKSNTPIVFRIIRLDHWSGVGASLSLRRHAHDRWLNVSDAYGDLSKSSSGLVDYTGFREETVCVAFFNVTPGNKDVVTPNTLTKEESRPC